MLPIAGRTVGMWVAAGGTVSILRTFGEKLASTLQLEPEMVLLDLWDSLLMFLSLRGQQGF